MAIRRIIRKRAAATHLCLFADHPVPTAAELAEERQAIAARNPARYGSETITFAEFQRAAQALLDRRFPPRAYDQTNGCKVYQESWGNRGSDSLARY